MKISTKGRYALRLMLDLATHATNSYVSLKEIASRQNISEKYLEQIITQLNRKGFVKSIRGAHGGYMLTQDPSYYTVGMILRLMEGSMVPVECVSTKNCSRIDTCVTYEVWLKIKEAVDNVIDNITLQDLLEMQRQKNVVNYAI